MQPLAAFVMQVASCKCCITSETFELDNVLAQDVCLMRYKTARGHGADF